MWAGFSDALKAEMAETGRVALPSDYSDEPYIITRKTIEDGRRQLVLRDPLPLNFPVRLLQGTDDTDVDISVALRLLDHAEGDDIRLTLIKGADHRLSTPDNLRLVRKLIHSIIMKC
jgi:alpha-beta hydrolase superfamily lysophospholipase